MSYKTKHCDHWTHPCVSLQSLIRYQKQTSCFSLNAKCHFISESGYLAVKLRVFIRLMSLFWRIACEALGRNDRLRKCDAAKRVTFAPVRGSDVSVIMSLVLVITGSTHAILYWWKRIEKHLTGIGRYARLQTKLISLYFFSVKEERRTRGHELTIAKKQCILSIRQFSFSQRTVH